MALPGRQRPLRTQLHLSTEALGSRGAEAPLSPGRPCDNGWPEGPEPGQRDNQGAQGRAGRASAGRGEKRVRPGLCPGASEPLGCLHNPCSQHPRAGHPAAGGGAAPPTPCPRGSAAASGRGPGCPLHVHLLRVPWPPPVPRSPARTAREGQPVQAGREPEQYVTYHLLLEISPRKRPREPKYRVVTHSAPGSRTRTQLDRVAERVGQCVDGELGEHSGLGDPLAEHQEAGTRLGHTVRTHG